MTTFAGAPMAGHANPQEAPKSWAVYYTNEVPAESFLRYDMVVFDFKDHPTLRPLIQRNKTVLGYLSLGEVDKDPERGYIEELNRAGLLLERNPNFHGRMIDIRDPEWARIVIEEIIPSILRKGFDGVMLDTVDSVVYLETKDPQKYAGMKAAAVNLIRVIRMHYPHIKIMMNRGLDILPEVETQLDYVLAESIHTTYNFKTGEHGLVKDSYYESIAHFLKASQARAPQLKVVSLDYWDMKDTKGVKAIYEAQRKHGFAPYVTDIGLKTLTPEPK